MLKPVRRAAAGGEVLRLLRAVRGVERGGSAGAALADQVHGDDAESDASVNLVEYIDKVVTKLGYELYF